MLTVSVRLIICSNSLCCHFLLLLSSCWHLSTPGYMLIEACSSSRVVELTLLWKQRHSQSNFNTLKESCFEPDSLLLYSRPLWQPCCNQFTANIKMYAERMQPRPLKGGGVTGGVGNQGRRVLTAQWAATPPPRAQFMIWSPAAQAVECSTAAFTWKYYLSCWDAALAVSYWLY